MKNSRLGKLENSLRIDFDDKSDDLWLSNGLTLRKLIGVLGMSLPLLLFLFVFIDADYGAPLDSISHYYHTRAGSVLDIIVGLLAIFLIIYKGNNRTGFYISLVAGVFAVLMLLFPTGNIADVCNCELEDHIISYVDENKFRILFHLICAAIFLLALAYISYFVFTKPDFEQIEVKKRNILIYRICGTMILISVVLIAIGIYTKNQWYSNNHLTFWLETVAIEFFGISWLTKGGAFQKDKKCV